MTFSISSSNPLQRNLNSPFLSPGPNLQGQEGGLTASHDNEWALEFNKLQVNLKSEFAQDQEKTKGKADEALRTALKNGHQITLDTEVEYLLDAGPVVELANNYVALAEAKKNNDIAIFQKEIAALYKRIGTLEEENSDLKDKIEGAALLQKEQSPHPISLIAEINRLTEDKKGKDQLEIDYNKLKISFDESVQTHLAQKQEIRDLKKKLYTAQSDNRRQFTQVHEEFVKKYTQTLSKENNEQDSEAYNRLLQANTSLRKAAEIDRRLLNEKEDIIQNHVRNNNEQSAKIRQLQEEKNRLIAHYESEIEKEHFYQNSLESSRDFHMNQGKTLEKEADDSKKEIARLKKELADFKSTNNISDAYSSKIEIPAFPSINKKQNQATIGRNLDQIKVENNKNIFLLPSNGASIIRGNEIKPNEIYLYDGSDFNVKRPFCLGEKENSPIIQKWKENGLHFLSISPDNLHLISNSRHGHIVWKLDNPNEPCIVDSGPESISNGVLHFHSISSDNKWAIYKESLSSKFYLINRTKNISYISSNLNSHNVYPILFNHDNFEWIASAGENTIKLNSINNEFKKEVELNFGEKEVTKLILSSNKKVLAAVLCEYSGHVLKYSIRLCKIEDLIKNSLDSLAEFSIGIQKVDALALSSNGKYLACANNYKAQIQILSTDFNTSTIQRFTSSYNKIETGLPRITALAWQEATIDDLFLITQSECLVPFRATSLHSLKEHASTSESTTI